MKITPLKAITPEAADTLADLLYSTVPLIRVTHLLAEVDGWTVFSSYSPNRILACPPVTGAWCSPPYWPKRRIWAWLGCRTPVLWQAIDSWCEFSLKRPCLTLCDVNAVCVRARWR